MASLTLGFDRGCVWFVLSHLHSFQMCSKHCIHFCFFKFLLLFFTQINIVSWSLMIALCMKDHMILVVLNLGGVCCRAYRNSFFTRESFYLICPVVWVALNALKVYKYHGLFPSSVVKTNKSFSSDRTGCWLMREPITLYMSSAWLSIQGYNH